MTTHTRYAELVKVTEKPERIEFSQVKKSDLKNQNELSELLFLIMTTTYNLAPEAQAEARWAMLEDLAQQDAEITAAIRARRRIKDVHPQTGVVIEDDAEDG